MSSRLVKSGIYAWIQHPSYTDQMLVLSGNLALFMRFGGLCCWIQIPHRQTYEGWGIQFYALVLSLRSCALSVRAKNEENMLKEVFGQEWVEWASRMPRALPGII
jgi:protein-S-isoprenylcysteine O-methyltransferase Ste14